MANPSTLRTGLADRLKTITGLAVYERWPGQLNPPCAVVDLTAAEPEQTMGRGDLTRWEFEINLLYPLSGGWENAQDRLDILLTTSSTGGVYGAIAGDRTLAGKAHSTFVKSLPGSYERRVIDEQIDCLAAIVRCDVWAS